jgi:hypothetical protein
VKLISIKNFLSKTLSKERSIQDFHEVRNLSIISCDTIANGNMTSQQHVLIYKSTTRTRNKIPLVEKIYRCIITYLRGADLFFLIFLYIIL